MGPFLIDDIERTNFEEVVHYDGIYGVLNNGHSTSISRQHISPLATSAGYNQVGLQRS